jgi:hypothetical protein
MVPTKDPLPAYTSLEEIRARKDELLAQLQTDATQVNTLWNQIFVKREDSSRGDYIASMISGGMTVIDLILLYRKLRRGYGSLFSKKKRKR